VPGIGPKIAATLMRKFGSLDELYDNIGRVAQLGLRGGGALGERLAAHRESVFLARRLTRIVCDMPLGVSAPDLRPRTPDLASLGALYDRLGFGPLLRRQGERLAAQCDTAAAAVAS
jgi:DNA polymerase I